MGDGGGVESHPLDWHIGHAQLGIWENTRKASCFHHPNSAMLVVGNGLSWKGYLHHGNW